MRLVTTDRPSPFSLDTGARAMLRARVEQAVQRARRSGRSTIAALTVAAPAGTDPTAVVCAARRPREPWFVFEQPGRGDAALATLGAALTLEAHGPDRFTTVGARWRAVVAEAACDPPEGPSGTGLVATGGFAFAPEGAASRPWRDYAPASLVVPEIALARRDGTVHLTVAVLCAADDTVDDAMARTERRLDELQPAVLPMLDPDPAGRTTVSSTMPPEHYEDAVARAVERIRAGIFEKVVLAREVEVHASADHDPAALLGVLRDAFPNCFVFAVGRGDSTFVAASPELLLRREGMRVNTLALAGSTRRSADPAVDDHLGEQLMRSAKDREEHEIVARRIERTLRPHALWVTTADEPVVVKMANIQHLATPIRAQLSDPRSAVELAGHLHPTPAVGGEPWAAAAPQIPALEGFDRGWYAGPVGWTDASDDGEFCVALRSALLTGPVARCFAGVGVVRDSDPAAELAETETKLGALLPILAS
jgi:salicylate biosynthesis isochorismate synthase/menaquinone-specific isochorismate synthase